ncbi:MAG: tetratricopeptide repeat protein [Rhodospirillaceae bacterium]|jgi:tetratricopeptide (TPR) repeat protein|nr:tetratricopeptide repeat protein [Rhodospirillaceae bacterium]MBT3887596.1 tetratricopeptide repeat protein [Rhodospirillaceae bacterium]MBT4116913.1 tetratricopeptide repeat protein [Rhodospirillaceae bacterium]MBT4721269.1 tetratricopeptide repeat protein [Rhodospirillaceae bacterium]MBT4749269.1 tetratricopeptide repeat protein [Rhodospirillaceae bacterium]
MTAGTNEAINKAISEAATHLEEGNLAKASEIASGVLAVLPDDARANFIYARCLIDTGDLQRAHAHLAQAIASQPSFADAHHAVGVLNQMVGRNDAAVAAFTKALDFDPSHLQANLSLGLLHCNLGKFDEALALVEKVISINSEVAAAHFVRGECLRGRDDQEATHAYKRAVMVNPEFAEAWFNLGVLSFQNNDFNGAVVALRQAARLLPDARPTSSYLGASLLEIGQFEEGLSEVGKSSGFLEFPADSDAPFRLVQFGSGNIEFTLTENAKFALVDV